MTNAEMDAIQVQDAPVFLKRTLSPGVKLLGEGLVQATDRTGARSHSQQRLSHFSYFVGTCSGNEHLRQTFCDVWLVTAIALKSLGMELTRAVSGHFNLLQPTRRCREITSVCPVAIAFAFWTTFSPRCSNEGI